MLMISFNLQHNPGTQAGLGLFSLTCFSSFYPVGLLRALKLFPPSQKHPALNQVVPWGLWEGWVLSRGSLLGWLAADCLGRGVTGCHRIQNHSPPGISQAPLPHCLYLKAWHIVTVSPTPQGAMSGFSPSLGKWQPKA